MFLHYWTGHVSERLKDIFMFLQYRTERHLHVSAVQYRTERHLHVSAV